MEELDRAFANGKISRADLLAGVAREFAKLDDLTSLAQAFAAVAVAYPADVRTAAHRLPAILINNSRVLGALDDLDGFQAWDAKNKRWIDSVQAAASSPRLPGLVAALGVDIRTFCVERRKRIKETRH